MSASDLTSSLQSGQSLASIASSKGVSQDDLVQAIGQRLRTVRTRACPADQATHWPPMATGTPGRRTSPGPRGTQTAPTSTYGITA